MMLSDFLPSWSTEGTADYIRRNFKAIKFKGPGAYRVQDEGDRYASYWLKRGDTLLIFPKDKEAAGPHDAGVWEPLPDGGVYRVYVYDGRDPRMALRALVFQMPDYSAVAPSVPFSEVTL